MLRLTPRGLRRLRLDTTRYSSISLRTALCNLLFFRGGNSAVDVQLAPNHAHGMKEPEPVRIFVSSQSGLVHQTANGEVSHHEAVELLAHQIGRFAAQHDLGAAQVGLEFIECGFYLPALMIKSCQLAGWSLARVEDCGRQPIDWLGTLDPLKAIIDHPQDDAV